MTQQTQQNNGPGTHPGEATEPNWGTASLPDLKIPPIWCPIPTRVHPDTEGIETHLVTWAQRFSLIRDDATAQRIVDCRFGKFTALCYPRANDLPLLAEWMIYMWILDDQVDAGELIPGQGHYDQVVKDLNSQLSLDERPSLPSQSPLVRAFQDLWRRTAPSRSQPWRERFLTHFRDCLLRSARDFQVRDRPMELDEFLRRRRINTAVELALDLIEVANEAELPGAITFSDLYRTIRHSANDVIGWVNDIYSVRKELSRGDSAHLVAVLRNNTGVTWDEAARKAVDMVESAIRSHLRSIEDLQAVRPFLELNADEWQTVDDSIAGIGSWIAGSLEWMSSGARYGHPTTGTA
jgi:hypothetical protein